MSDDYAPPVDEMQFLLHDVLGFAHEDLDRETTGAILEEAAKLASGVLAPLNHAGDVAGATLEDGAVKTAPGWKEAYAAYCAGGWNAVPFDPAYGGQGLPYALAFPIQEMWQGANLSFGLCPLLNQGVVEGLLHHGSEEQKAYYLPKLISGEWTGTMHLTESGAGSDLGLIRTRAAAQDDGSYKLSGQKIFITYGDHGLTENIIHLVLARIEGAPEDVKGISLFIVPKILEDGTRNAVRPIGLEHKMGIHASPTCTMEFDGAVAYLVGEAHQGLKYMFTTMNNARLSVGLQGVAVAERAYQKALAYARERVQGRSLATGERVPIIEHPDVRRMLLDMKCRIAAGRAMAYAAAVALDKGDAQSADILTPLVKSGCTDMAFAVASTGLQVHGGMGFIEETGAAQYVRDSRILSIYEGTNGIQALDLLFRKTLRDDGAAVKAFISDLREDADEALTPYFEALDKAVDALIKADKERAAFVAVPYLNAFALITGAVFLDRAARISAEKAESADFYKAHILPHARAYLEAVFL